MPSGAKKRKAAKKKKEQQAYHNQSHDDPESQDESDGGEADSPASRDHHNHQHPFKEGNGELENRDPTPSQSFDFENKSMAEVARGLEGAQKVGIEDDRAVNIGMELKSKEDLGSQSIGIKHEEFVKESTDGSSSSSSSSDNESHVVEKTMTEAVPQNGKRKPAGSFAEEVIQGTEKLSLGETTNSVVETVKPLITESEKVINVTQDDSVVISVVTEVVESSNKNEESKTNEEMVIPFMEENAGACSNSVETLTNENEDKILPTSVAPAETSNDCESLRNSKISDSPEIQSPRASAPRGEQRTSWMSCCGLLDALTGSSR